MTGPDAAALAAWALAAHELGRAAHPGLEVGVDELARAATLRLTQADEGAPLGSLAELDAAELYLACACMRGDGRALAALRARYYAPCERRLARMGLGAAQRDDVWQTLAQRLVVNAADGPAKIARYAGTGNLAGLVRVAATRLALNWIEQEKRLAGSDDLLDQVSSGGAGPELQLIKEQHRQQLKQEVEAAIAGLSPRERMVLRLHLVEQVGIDAIAATTGMHRATAARWVASAKETLADRVRERLVARWRVGDGSLPALRTLVDSQIDLSLPRLLSQE